MQGILEKNQVIFKNGKPQAVILDVEKYEKLLEIAEEKKDLTELRRIKNGKTSFRKLKAYLKECGDL